MKLLQDILNTYMRANYRVYCKVYFTNLDQYNVISIQLTIDTIIYKTSIIDIL